jgi:hypothetical protein
MDVSETQVVFVYEEDIWNPASPTQGSLHAQAPMPAPKHRDRGFSDG